MKKAFKTYIRKTKDVISESMRQKLWDALLICSFLALMVTSVIVLRWDSILFVLLLLLNLFIFASYRYGFSIPGIAHLSRKYVRKNVQEFSKINARYFKIKIIYYLVLLAHDIDAAFGLLFHNPDFYILEERVSSKGKSQYFVLGKRKTLEESMNYLRAKKRKATIASLSTSAGITLAVIIGTLISSTQIRAATYQWVQSSWAGGADTSAIAEHPGSVTGWTKYFSKDTGVEASSSIALSAVSTSTIDTTNTDFSAGTSTNTYISNGSVIMLKPAGASCSTSTECGDIPVETSCTSSLCRIAVGSTYLGGKVAYVDSTGAHGFIAAESDQSSSVTFDQAASTCSSLVLNNYDDWFVPNTTQLTAMCNNQSLIGNFYTSNPAYWTSEEKIDDSLKAGSSVFDQCGYYLWGWKTQSLRVRCIRSF